MFDIPSYLSVAIIIDQLSLIQQQRASPAHSMGLTFGSGIDKAHDVISLPGLVDKDSDNPDFRGPVIRARFGGQGRIKAPRGTLKRSRRRYLG